MKHRNPRWTAIDHVLLDMDGTVLDLAFDNHLWLSVVPERYGALRGLSAEQALAELRVHFRAHMHTLRWYDTDFWSELTGLDIAALHEEHRERITIHPGSLEFLEAVQGSGRSLWLATNAFPDSIRPKLAQTGIGRFFEHVISSHEMQAPKEDPRYWQRMRAKYPFDPARALFADDSLPVLQAARGFGIAEVFAMHHPDSSAPPRTFEEFASVARLNELLPLPTR